MAGVISYGKKSLVFILIMVGGCGFVPPTKANAADTYSVIYSEVTVYNSDPMEAEWITQAICYASGAYGVDPLLITAVMETESHFHFGSYSSAGAIGLMQLMPGTAAGIGVDPYNPLENVIGGAYYLRCQLDSFASCGEYAGTYAVAAYNAGPEAVRDYGGCPPYSETINYVHKVANTYNNLLSRYYS